MPVPNKALGQHWLLDEAALATVAVAAEITPGDTVLEIGPGPGGLTKHLLSAAKQVVAVEIDQQLIVDLVRKYTNDNLTVINTDILEFDLSQLPLGYKVAANIPYYLTSALLQKLCTAANSPHTAVLLIQKEVAERITAKPGDLSVLALSVQYFMQVRYVQTVPKELFMPVPKVDSAILQLKLRPEPYFPADQKRLFRLLKAGFGERRKKLVNALAGGLAIDKLVAAGLLGQAGINTGTRAQELSLDDWGRLYAQAVTAAII